MMHQFYKTGDKDAPDHIKDNRGSVVLQLCKVCGQAESEIAVFTVSCPGSPISPKKMDRPPVKKAHQILKEAAVIYEERNAVYGDNYKRVGKVMEAHFPDGLFVRTADDWNRLHIFLLGVVKDTRYITNWNNGGHLDSNRDATVYSALLEEIDTEIAERSSAERSNCVSENSTSEKL